MILPARFIPIAEACGLIVPLGRWVMLQACNQAKRRVIAGGIEENTQLEFLRHHHCAEGQGFLFSHPVSTQSFVDLLHVGLNSPINTSVPSESAIHS
jgi:EAL domain-containing protein (putative c-di-GMP-specific phosphodiesterase class I)